MAEEARRAKIDAVGETTSTPGTDEEPKVSPLTVLRMPSFGWVVGDSAFGAIGFQMVTMSQAWVTLELTDSDAWVGAVNGIAAIPAAALVLFGGVLADRINRRTLLLWTRLTLAFLGFFTGLLVFANIVTVWHLIAIAIVAGIVRVFALIAGNTMIVDIVGRDRMFVGNAIAGIAFNGATFAGPAIGGILIAQAGAEFAYLVASAMITVAVLFTLKIKLPERAPRVNNTSITTDLREGLSYIWRTPALRWLMFMGFFVMFATMYFPLIPRIARDSLDAGADGYGSILAATGIGSLVGSLALIMSGNIRSVGRILLVVPVVFSILLVAFAFVNTLEAAWAVAFGLGAVIPWWANTMRTAFQMPATEEMRGRVMALFALTGQFIQFGWFVGGTSSELIGPDATLIAGGVVCASFYIFAFTKSSAIRQLGRE
jgi:predicted MFS family arabinose efflux permease